MDLFGGVSQGYKPGKNKERSGVYCRDLAPKSLSSSPYLWDHCSERRSQEQGPVIERGEKRRKGPRGKRKEGERKEKKRGWRENRRVGERRGGEGSRGGEKGEVKREGRKWGGEQRRGKRKREGERRGREEGRGRKGSHLCVKRMGSTWQA